VIRSDFVLFRWRCTKNELFEISKRIYFLSDEVLGRIDEIVGEIEYY